MTHAEQILQAVAAIIGKNENAVFSRNDVRAVAGVDREDWQASYIPIFQGMRSDHPGGAPNVGQKYKNVFERVAHGKHTLTDYSRKLMAEVKPNY